MRINVSIELRRPARRSVALLVGALLLITPAVVLANHQFIDVSDTTPFHKEIGAIAKAGITAGFPGKEYRPSEHVTRQAMAAFMERGLGRVGMAVSSDLITPSVAVDAGRCCGSYVPVRELTITVPGQANSYTPNQLVHLQGRVGLRAAMSSANGCPCEFAAVIQDATASAFGPIQSQTFGSSNTTFNYSFDVEALLAAPPGPRTYRLLVAVNGRETMANEVKFDLSVSTSLSAETFPFGPKGGNTTSAPGAENEPRDVDQLPERRRDE